MNINFFDDPLESPKSREDVRIKQLGIYLHDDRRRVAVGFELTPFLERPSIEVIITNERGERASSMSIIDTMNANFSVVMHLRDKEPADAYEIKVILYYATPDTDRMDIQTLVRQLDGNKVGTQ